ncbi:hypothetical protein UVI_02011160 [Ustilaginoidea virens]|uniref:Uncharacterized protein n=1 Tax=Ustilaginoidea virens TaxID=1159556 RepID=A0A1B5KZI8_USTVR|nr:hypothetical protein UVI_02011160 [Ustilaginoidea virens]
MVPLICEMLDALMKRLGYRIYLATNTISSPNSVADIDFRIINHIAYAYPDSCVGAHLLSPPCQAPTWQAAPLEWVKWKMMTSLRTPGLGYTRDDIAALRKHRPPRQGKQRGLSLVPGLDSKAFESNMLAYALCDSPTGLLLFVIMVLRLLGPKHDFSSGDIIQLAELTWLPGPEGTMRLWAHCSSERDELPRPSRKPKVGITAFSGSTDGETGTQQQTCSAASSPDEHTCLAWAKTTYNVVSWQKAPGSSGLLAWERPEVLVAGVRALAKVVFPKDDSRRQAAKEAAKKPRITSLERVVLGENESARAEGSGTTIRGDAPPTLASDDDVERAQTKQGTSTDAKGAKRPPTPLFPLAWGQRSEAVRESRHASRSSSGGSPTTIKPLTSG